MEHYRFSPHVSFPIIKTSSNAEYSIYSNVSGAMILFGSSKKEENVDYPIASIHFKSVAAEASTEKDLISFICPGGAVNRFQGIINKDNQSIELGVSNLLIEGSLRFQLFRCNDIGESSMQNTINKINVVSHNSTVWVKSDTTRDEGALLLSSVKNESNQSISVGDAEAKAETERKEGNKSAAAKGTYVLITIVPESNTLAESLFEKTYWATPEYFLVKRSVASPRALKKRLWRDVQRDDISGIMLESYVSSNSAPARRVNNSTPSSRARSINSNEDVQYDSELNLDAHRILNEVHESAHSLGISRATNSSNNIPEDNSSDNNEFEEDECEETSGSDEELVLESKSITKHPLTNSVAKARFAAIVKNSKAAELKTGPKIEVRSQHVDVELAYHRMTEAVILGLSVEEALETVTAAIDNHEEIFNHLFKELQNKKYGEFLRGKVYASEECVICMESLKQQEHAAPSGVSIFFKCAHECTHNECAKKLDRCPMCRSRIIAKLSK